MKLAKRFLTLIVLSIVFFFIGITICLLLLKKERFVNLKSGRMKEVVSISQFEIFNSGLPVNAFQIVPSYVSEEEEKNYWFISSRKYAIDWFRPMYSFEGGKISYEMMQLGRSFPFIDQEISQQIKKRYLELVLTHRDGRASKYVEDKLHEVRTTQANQ